MKGSLITVYVQNTEMGETDAVQVRRDGSLHAVYAAAATQLGLLSGSFLLKTACGAPLPDDKQEMLRDAEMAAGDTITLEPREGFAAAAKLRAMGCTIGAGALGAAAAAGDVQKLQLLLSAGVSVDAVGGRDGQTALHMAAAAGQVDAVQLLLDADAEVDKKDTLDRTPLLRAVRAGSRGIPVVTLLLSRSAVPPASSLHAAVLSSCPDSLPLLAPYFSSPDPRRQDTAATPLHLAAQNANVPVIRALLSLGADPTLRDLRRLTPLDYAISSGNAAAACLLERATQAEDAEKAGKKKRRK